MDVESAVLDILRDLGRLMDEFRKYCGMDRTIEPLNSHFYRLREIMPRDIHGIPVVTHHLPRHQRILRDLHRTNETPFPSNPIQKIS
jgi:hypothetical protein